MCIVADNLPCLLSSFQNRSPVHSPSGRAAGGSVPQQDRCCHLERDGSAPRGTVCLLQELNTPATAWSPAWSLPDILGAGVGGGAFPGGGTPRDPHPCPTPHPPVSSADATQRTYGPIIPAGASTGRKAPALRLTSGAPAVGWEPAGHLRKSHRATVSTGLDLACDSFRTRATPTRPSFALSNFVN